MAQHFVKLKPCCKRLGWLALIWAASVMALGGVAYLIKGLMKAAGLGM